MTSSKMKRGHWTAQNVPDLSGKVAIITGANSGLGYEAALALAARNARVILACRNKQRGETAAASIRRALPLAGVEIWELDLASLEAIRHFAGRFLSEAGRLDLLLNNAGVMAIPFRRTVDGFEMQFGTNHLGHFALTGLLLPALRDTPGARIVTMSSGAHVFGTIAFDNLDWHTGYEKWRAYGRSKLANLLFAYELARRLAKNGAQAISLAAHPGYASTNLQLVGPQMEASGVQMTVMRVANRVFAQSARMGALPELYAATAPSAPDSAHNGIRNGDYIGPTGLGSFRGYPGRVRSNARSYDEALAARIWQASEEMTGVKFEL